MFYPYTLYFAGGGEEQFSSVGGVMVTHVIQ
jgi:hypothetical protein